MAMRTPINNYPPDEEIIDAAGEHETFMDLAKTLGFHKMSLYHHCKRQGIGEDVKKALAGRDGAPDETRAVDDPLRVKAASLEAEVKVLRKEAKEYEKALSTQEEFFDRIVEATRVEVDPPEYTAHKSSGKKPTNSVITPIFDQQFGQFVRPTDTPGNQGAFSVEVFDKRLDRWVDGVTGIIGKRAEGYNIEELIIPFGGDHVEGDEIFAGQSWQLEFDPCKQVWELAQRMDAAIREVVRFAKEEVGIKHIACYGVDDNHGKVGGKKSGARPATYSWNWLLLKMLFENLLRKEPINEFAIEPGGSLFFYCAGHEFQLIHGHQIRGWGGLPFYGLTKFDGRSMRLHNRMYRYLLMGHHHQPAEIPNGAGETIVSGDWVGANNLSSMMTAGSRPMQRVIFVSRKWGVDGGERVWFTEAEEAYQPTEIRGNE